MAACVLTKILFVSLAVVQLSSAANILILCFPQLSHLSGPTNVGKALQQQGHNVTLAIPPEMQERLADKGVNILLYHSLGDFTTACDEPFRLMTQAVFTGKSGRSFVEKLIAAVPRQILTDEQFYRDIQASKPDLLILDPGVPSRLLTAMACKLDLPFVFIGKTIQNQFPRAPLLPSVVPNNLFDATDQMTFSERLSNTFTEIMSYYYVPLVAENSVSRYCPDKPDMTIHELQAKALLWIEVHDGILDFNKPLMPNIKQVSHLLPLQHKPLPAEFQTFMDNAQNGVVIVSFGSVLKWIPSEIIDKLLAGFRLTKYNFVIQYSMLKSNEPNKIWITSWIPQFELLSHKNTILFITHCGVNGQQEALYAGVPMLGIPLVNDQPRNAARIVGKGFGLRLDLKNFTVDELVSAIEEIITNPEYKRRTKKASAIIRSARVPPVEEAAYWINHVLTFGGDHLRSLGQDIPLWKYLGLDIFALCCIVWHIFLFITIKMVYLCLNCCFSRKDKDKKE